MTKCVVCERRPAREDGYCHDCAGMIGADKKRGNGRLPVKYLVYRDNVVGLFPNGGGMLRPELLKLNPERLPKSRTLNLNNYLPGFTREAIKRFKKCVLQLAHA